jgi:hypothetical protein
MKRIAGILFLLILMNFPSKIFADSFIIEIYYLDGEKSKDSWSSETNVSVDGSSIIFSKKWSGSAKSRNKDIEKKWNLSDEQVSALQKIIWDNKLLVRETLEDKDEKYKSYERFVNLAVSISLAEAMGFIKINGDMLQIQDSDLYLRTMKLMNLIDEYAQKS